EPARPGGELSFVIPKGSLLDRWRAAGNKVDKAVLAREVQRLLTEGPTAANEKADTALYRRLASLHGPLFGRLWEQRPKNNTKPRPESVNAKTDLGLDPALFGRHPAGKGNVDPSSLCVKAPAVVE